MGVTAPRGILIFFHCRANTGYAIRSLEEVFLASARRLVPSDEAIHFSYRPAGAEWPKFLPRNFKGGVLEFDAAAPRPADRTRVAEYVKAHGIELALGFDQPVRRPVYGELRRAGIRTLISYWGAPMSSINRRPLLWLKRLEVWATPHKPDLFIFESEAMRETAIRGRGIPPARTALCRLGVDAERFRPTAARGRYAHQEFGIPSSRRIVYYSGHFEPRKGVGVIVRAAIELIDQRGRRDVHFLLLGSKPGEERPYASMLEGTMAAAHVTFAGYREDVDQIVPACDIATIASTGWDSFTMSALETAASGLPLVVSRLQGLVETVEVNSTGFIFESGNHSALAGHIEALLRDDDLRARMGSAARARVVAGYTREQQITCLSDTLARAVDRASGS